MTYRSKNILPYGFRSKPIINKVLDYVFGDFKGPIGRKTYSLLATRSCIIKVFRFQRKTLLLFFGFGFFIILFFFLLDFSKTPGRIFMKFSGMVYIGLAWLKLIFLYDDVTSCLRNWWFSDFEGVIL